MSRIKYLSLIAVLFILPHFAHAAPIQIYGHIEGTGGSTILVPDTPWTDFNEGLTTLYLCNSYPTSGVQTNCNSSFDWSALSETGYNGGFGVGGASSNGTYYFNIFDSNGGRPYDGSKAVAYIQWTYTSGVWSTPPPPAPSTQFNEVIDYVYDPNLNNSFGTSTVGAIFSIPQPNYVDSIGYDLLDPTNTIVDTDFHNGPATSTYTVAKEYNFNATGVYTVRAWFMQNGNKIINPTTLSIIINTPTWEYDPVTGDLVPSASTTIATSTLLAFKVDCPDDLIIGGLCKLVVGFFVPSPAAIQGISISFNNLMSKAPFSFFTQSKQLLDAFRTGASATGGSFNLTLYGSDIEIVGTTTANAIGVGSSPLALLKSVMTMGLWILLAWYLYWRIASIFGV